MTTVAAADRRDDLVAGLEAVRGRIAAACDAAGRDPGDITLVVVTKTFPASDVLLLAELGVRDIGENRHPEGAQKAAACAEVDISGAAPDLTWHFVGALQTNKAAAVTGYASWVHSVDRVRLVDALERGAARNERSVDCLVQVSLDPPDAAAGRSGAGPGEVADVAAALAAADHLRLRGVMAVAPLGADPRPAFEELAQVAAGVRAAHPGADVVSAGMSGDLEQAIAAGATHLRVGGAILGKRPPLG
jgi:pyridoxal phosphate enzyme (YggS family)